MLRKLKVSMQAQKFVFENDIIAHRVTKYCLKSSILALLRIV